MLGDVASIDHAHYPGFKVSQRTFAQHLDVALRNRLGIAQVRHGNYLGLRICQLSLAVERDSVAGAQITQASRLFGRSGHLGCSNVHEVLLELVELHVTTNDAVGETKGHLLSSAASRNQPYAYFHQTHVEFGMRLNVVGMKRQLASATQRHVMRRYDNGYRREACPRHRILKLGNHQVDFVKLLVPGKHE